MIQQERAVSPTRVCAVGLSAVAAVVGRAQMFRVMTAIDQRKGMARPQGYLELEESNDAEHSRGSEEAVLQQALCGINTTCGALRLRKLKPARYRLGEQQ